jgi:hypothetical protein
VYRLPAHPALLDRLFNHLLVRRQTGRSHLDVAYHNLFDVSKPFFESVAEIL